MPTASQNTIGKTVTENNKKVQAGEFEKKEYYINEFFDSVGKSLELFQDDALFSKPGKKKLSICCIISVSKMVCSFTTKGSLFLYTTHGWTLVSAVVESVVKKTFPQYMKDLFDELGLKHTYLDENKPLIYNRSRYCYIAIKYSAD